ncbi:MAG: hypothetical protein IKF19_03655 [Bacilli bacterium]|nr:hypothetical protein [Bacilli bacterium]
MDNKYDTILKEKKANEDTPKEHKHKYFKLAIFFGILLSLLVIIISYTIYYNTILDNESIFFNNIMKVKENYYPIYKDISFDYELDKDYLIEGNIDIGNDNYSYSFGKNGSKIKRVITSNDKNITYYFDGKDNYIKLSNLGDFYIKENVKLNDIKYYKDNIKEIKKDFNSYLYNSILDKSSYELFNQIYNIDNLDDIINNINNNYKTTITSNKYIRKVYLDNKTPIVEINLVLNKNDINNILGSNSGIQVNNDYQVNITMKNHAITNEIKEIKMIINNKTKKIRDVLTYNAKGINYTNSKNEKYNIKYNLNKNNIEIKKNNVLSSVVQISAKSKTNIYTYKKINKIYTVGLSASKVNNKFEYDIETNIENIAKAIKISGEYKKGKVINENIEKVINLDSLNLEQQNVYKQSINNIFK